MKYLEIGLFAEGATDHRFLSILLSRLCEDICSRLGDGQIEIGPLRSLRTPVKARAARRDEQVLEAVKEASILLDVLFIHADGNGDPAAVRKLQIDPGRSRIQAEIAREVGEVIGVVPVRESEAWPLADGNAIRAAFGSSHDDVTLGIPATPGDVEGILDPKKALEQAWKRAWPKQRRRRTAQDFLEALGERVSFDRLRLVPAFRVLEDDLREALRRLRYLRT
jgi:hypothetical protein